MAFALGILEREQKVAANVLMTSSRKWSFRTDEAYKRLLRKIRNDMKA
jgi:hypothetical protein